MGKRTLVTVVLALSGGLLLAACDGSESGSSAPGDEPVTTTTTTTSPVAESEASADEAEVTDTDDETDSSDQPDDDSADSDDDSDSDAATDSDAGDSASAIVPDLAPVGPDDSGDDVVALQEHLDTLGFAPGAPDGSYGARTEAAVSAFQELSGLAATGEADRRTVKALAEYRYHGPVVRAGDEGKIVEELQTRLAGGPFDPGPADGQYGGATAQAVWALEKLAGVPVDGNWGPLDEQAWNDLQEGKLGRAEKSNDQRWVEVDLSQQLAKIYDPGETTPTLIVHVSSGSGVAWANEGHSGSSVTPLGDFHITRRISGWRESSLDIGRLYNPLYFNGGIAFHGASSVPLRPASHGCIRVPMHIAEYLPAELPDGTPVHVLA